MNKKIGPLEFKAIINDGCHKKLWRSLKPFDEYDLGVYGKGYRIENQGATIWTPVRITVTGRGPRIFNGTAAIRVMIEFLGDKGHEVIDVDHGFALPVEWN